MKIIKESGTDRAAEALSKYVDDIDYLKDQILITARNTQWINDNLYNNRVKPHSIVWSSLLELVRFDLGESLTSSQLQAGFKKLGIDYKEFLKPAVEMIEQEREDNLGESKGTLIEILDDQKTEGKDTTVTDYLNMLEDVSDFEIASALRSALKYGLINNKTMDYIVANAKREVTEPKEMKKESLENNEVAKVIDKIQELETELEVISNDKEIDKKQIKSIKDKISRLNKKLNEDKDIAEELNLNEDKDNNIENIKSALKASGIKSERTLDLMSKDVLKTLQANYDKDCMDQEGNYYNPAITSAIQDVIERITKKRPQMKMGEGRVKELLYANKNVSEKRSIQHVYVVEKIIEELDSEGKVYIDSPEDGYQVLTKCISPERPEDYDEGFVTGWNKGENPEYDKEQEERFEKATEAYENGEVFQITDLEDDTIEMIIYGYEELKYTLDSMGAQIVDIEKLMR